MAKHDVVNFTLNLQSFEASTVVTITLGKCNKLKACWVSETHAICQEVKWKFIANSLKLKLHFKHAKFHFKLSFESFFFVNNLRQEQHKNERKTVLVQDQNENFPSQIFPFLKQKKVFRVVSFMLSISSAASRLNQVRREKKVWGRIWKLIELYEEGIRKFSISWELHGKKNVCALSSF